MKNGRQDRIAETLTPIPYFLYLYAMKKDEIIELLKEQIKADAVCDYYGGVEPSRPTTSYPSFTQIAPVMLSEEEFSLSGITITFNSGTTISVKRATPGGIIKMLCDYERKEGDPCIL